MAKKQSITTPSAAIKPKVVKPLTEKEKAKAEFIESIRKRISDIELPKELRLSSYENIINTAKFFDNHLSRISLSGREIDKPYNDRLKQALKLIGIEIENFDKMLSYTK